MIYLWVTCDFKFCNFSRNMLYSLRVS